MKGTYLTNAKIVANPPVKFGWTKADVIPIFMQVHSSVIGSNVTQISSDGGQGPPLSVSDLASKHLNRPRSGSGSGSGFGPEASALLVGREKLSLSIPRLPRPASGRSPMGSSMGNVGFVGGPISNVVEEHLSVQQAKVMFLMASFLKG